MALLPYADPQTAPPDVREVLSALPDLNLFRMVSQAPTMLRPWLGLGGALLTSLELDPLLREFAVLQVAQSAGCDYERIQHEAMAAGVGATADQIALLAGPPADRLESAMARAFTPADRAVIDITDEVVATGRAGESRLVTLGAHLSDREIVELLLVIGYYVGIALLAETLRLDPDEPAQMAVVDAAIHAEDIR
jgi:AhpD family alkylhydroperoxidase